MYLALYRKYRPTTFDEVVGQDHITTSLRNQIKNDSISHAYLFCGTRGTGKTSVAKIFARSINCETPNNGSACGKCITCKALSDASNLDILEIDAASNNRVDEIRELREKVKYPPVNGKYKVYIIDEVHMLTDSAFNALLKTLEEPPKHVVFILATTEVQKLPATILSRCLRFDFKLVSNAELEKLIKKIFDKEKIKYEDSAVGLIARLGEGSVRDTLSVADMCVAYADRNVTYKAVLDAVGTIDKSTLSTIAKFILSGDVNNLLAQINAVIELGKNVVQIAKDLAGYFRDLAVVKTCDNFSEILSLPKDISDTLKSQADSVSIDVILKSLSAYAGLDNEFRLTTNPRLILEVTTLNLCDEIRSILKMDNNKSISSVETSINNSLNTENSSKVDNTNEINNVSNSNSNVNEGKDTKTLAQTIFGKMLVELRNKNEMMMLALLGDNAQVSWENNTLKLVSSNEQQFKALTKSNNIDILNSVIKELDNKYNIVIEYQEIKEKPTLEDILKLKLGDDLKIKE